MKSSLLRMRGWELKVVVVMRGRLEGLRRADDINIPIRGAR
jgi:hypothetical protein